MGKPLHLDVTADGSVRHPIVLQQEDQTKGEALRFEIMRLDDVDGSAVDSTVVDAASVNRIVQQAAAMGQRIYIRPAETSAS
ncbi:hypothetical protein ACIOGX_23600 [Streptomyces sp. NPDC088147]|uniref:hypothetical protein n=1 Tax=unclassified Streptomyces TaxID=2593676 RepID=UPI00101C464B|nr:hypothetical protein [Streptomyces sp. L-9-10]RYJ24568.1 hypothetical protein CU044_4479 [Streptomyces sp. L-9-10]